MQESVVPSDLQPYFETGIKAYTQGSYEYAVDLLTFVIQQAPDATEARRYLRLAIQKQASLSSPSPVTQLGMALATMPVRWWAIIAELRGNVRRATNVYEWLLQLMPRSSSILMRLAATLSRSGLDDAAEETYEELLEINPNHLRALRKLSQITMKSGKDDKARRCLERILKLHPNDLEAQQNLRNLDALGTIKKGFAT